MASESCPPGQIYYPPASGCRECENFCGEQYGGPNTFECLKYCPGYGQTTTQTTTPGITDTPDPSNEIQPWLIGIICAGVVVAAIIVCIIVAVACRLRKCRFDFTKIQQPVEPEEEKKTFVAEESDMGQNGKSKMAV